MIRPAYLRTIFLALCSLFLVLSIILFPKQAYESSLRGLTIWWDIVFPALLPFFITAELLIGFGVVHFLGVLLEPCMRPLFRVPGVGGFVMSMGIASGYPMGAKLTIRLREQGMISRTEGERLISITSTSGPLFMFGAVAVGFFHDVSLGIIIASAHYLAAFFVGLLMRFYRYNDEPIPERAFRPQKSLIFRALQEMHRARIKDGRTIGSLIGEAVMSSVQTLFLIGGFIIIFSVLINVMNLIQMDQLFSLLISFVLIPFGIPIDLSSALFSGIFEITLGSQMASASTTTIALVHKVAITSAIIAWSGLSVHAQVVSMIAKTDLSYRPYFIARLLHAILACICTYILWTPFQHITKHASSPVFDTISEMLPYWSPHTFFIGSLGIVTLFSLITLSFITWAKMVERA